jgi:hypothetical protein
VLVLFFFAWRHSYAAHPLITEDTGTQGKGKFQLELTGESGRDVADGTKTESLTGQATFSWGFVDTADLIIGVPRTRETVTADGETAIANGVGDVGFDIKWRFYEKGDFSLAFKPGITLPSGDENKGLGSGKKSYTAYGIATLAPDPWAFHLHVGYVKNANVVNEREGLWHVSAAAVREFKKKLKVALDVGANRNSDGASSDHPEFLILGLIYSVTPDFDLDLGFKDGLSKPETDSTWLAGVTLRF